MAFNVQQAIKDGYTMEEINQYLASKKTAAPVQPQVQQVQQPQIPQAPASPQPSGAMAILDSILKPFFTTGKNIGGAGFEGGRALMDKLGVQNVYADAKGNAVKNPFLSDEELQSISDDPMGAMGKQLRASAGVASWAVPFGKGAGLISKVLAPGAAVGALSKASEDNTGVSDILKGAAGGALTAGVVHGGGKLLEGGAKLIGKGVNKVGNMVANDAVQGYGKATPTMYEKAVTEHGLDINKLIQKHVPKGANYEAMLGDATKRGSGGVLGFKMGQAENTIGRAVEAAGATVRVSGDDVVKELVKQRKLLKATVGNERNIEALDAIIEETQKLFKNGMSTKQLLKLKRAADSKFGSAVVDETTGSVAAQAQKVLANFARNKLKQILPTVKDALEMETELYTLKPILNKARGTLNTQGSQIRTGSFNGVTDIINPFSYYKSWVNNPNNPMPIPIPNAMDLGEKMANFGKKVSPSKEGVGLLEKVLGQNPSNAFLGQVSSRIGASTQGSGDNKNQNEAAAQNSSYNNQGGNDPNSQMYHTDNIPQQQITGNETMDKILQPAIERRIKPEQLMQVLMSPQISAKTKAALKDAYDVQEQSIKAQEDAIKNSKNEESTKFSEGDKKFVLGERATTTALQSIDNIDTGPIAAGQSMVSELLGTQSPEVTKFKSQLAIARTAVRNALLGANMSDQEIKSLLDATFDYSQPKQVLKARMEALVGMLKDYRENVAGNNQIGLIQQ